jgi:hypothetical protein
MTTPHDDGIYFEIERFFNGLNQQNEQNIIEPIHVNIQIPDQTNHIEPSPVSEKIVFFCLFLL